MTANLGALLPRALVLLDVPGKLRGRRGVVVRQIHAPLGDAVTVEVCVGPCARETHSTDCVNAIGLHPDELLLIPADALEPTYPCCEHCQCPADATGHPAPCTGCQQQPRLTADQHAARSMAADAGYIQTALCLAFCIFGALLFLALLGPAQHVMCAVNHDQLRYCAHYQETAR